MMDLVMGAAIWLFGYAVGWVVGRCTGPVAAARRRRM